MERFRLVLDLQLFAQEKTEPATPRKRQEARKKGQVARSMELPSAFVLLFGFLALTLLGGYFQDRLTGLFNTVYYDYLTKEMTTANIEQMFMSVLAQVLVMLLPVFLVVIVVAVLGNFLQFGLLFTGEPLKMKFSKLNPINGFKRIFSLRSVVEFVKSVLKVTIVGIVVFLTFWGQKETLFQLSQMPVGTTFAFVASLTVELGLKIGVTLIVLALLDYFYQRFEHEKSLRMSKQDIKDEFKKTEGDPLIKSKIKERQRKIAMQRMMQEVPKADVVITNPTHYAVALQYETGMEAPKVLAKGTDLVALKIREIAAEHGVVTMENKPLARALYEQVDIGEMIPAELFQAVAEVLAYVYKLKGIRK